MIYILVLFFLIMTNQLFHIYLLHLPVDHQLLDASDHSTDYPVNTDTYRESETEYGRHDRHERIHALHGSFHCTWFTVRCLLWLWHQFVVHPLGQPGKNRNHNSRKYQKVSCTSALGHTAFDNSQRGI